MASHSLTPPAETSIFYLLLRFFILFHADFHGKKQHNRLFLNSHGWTGSSMKRRLMQANLFKYKLICPH